jgi:ribosomal-protein-alanine N-acetyltransferase
MIQTERLELVPCDVEHLEAALYDRAHLAQLLRVAVPQNWPVFPESLKTAYQALKIDPKLRGWLTYFFVLRQAKVLIGSGGYKGRADRMGFVEIGYSVIPDFRDRGLATEAARGLVEHAFLEQTVNVVCAHTLAGRHASARILEKLGMRRTRLIDDSRFGPVWRWELKRRL